MQGRRGIYSEKCGVCSEDIPPYSIEKSPVHVMWVYIYILWLKWSYFTPPKYVKRLIIAASKSRREVIDAQNAKLEKYEKCII